jgi:hypothetical protein
MWNQRPALSSLTVCPVAGLLLYGCVLSPEGATDAQDGVDTTELAQTSTPSSGTILGSRGLCLTVSASSTAVLSKCVPGSAAQNWEQLGSGQIRQVSTGKCLKTQGNASAFGTPLVVGTCSGASSETWGWRAPLPLLAINGTEAYAGVATSDAVDGTPVVLTQLFLNGANPVRQYWFMPKTLHRVRVHVIAVADDDCVTTAPTTTPADIKGMLDLTNNVFARAGIQFVFSDASPTPDWSTLCSTRFNKVGVTPQEPGINEVLNEYAENFEGKLVIYLLGRLPGSGFGSGPTEYNFVAFASNLAAPDSWGFAVHEIGHYFGLPHTHLAEPQNYAAALAEQFLNGSGAFNGDAGIAGDTPPDPTENAWIGSGVAKTDPLNLLGEVYNPDRTNMMSYWSPADAFHRSITPGQVLGALKTLKHPVRVTISQDAFPSPKHVATLKTFDAGAGNDLPLVFLTGGEGRMAYKYRRTNSYFTHWLPFDGPTGTLDRIAGVNLSDGTQQLFVVDASGVLHTRWQGSNADWSGWTPQSTPFTVRDVATSRTSDKRARLYIVGRNGKIAVTQKTTTAANSPWTAWQDLSHGVGANRISVARTQDGREHPFMVGTDDLVYANFENTAGGTFNGWAAMGSATMTDIDAGYAADGRIQIYGVRASDGNVRVRSKLSTDPNSGWSSWETIQPALDDIDSISSLRRPDGTPQLIAVRNNALFMSIQKSGGWTQWTSL